MEDPGNGRGPGPGNQRGDEIQIGGLPLRWDLSEDSLLGGLTRRYRQAARRIPVAVALTSLAVGLVAGFAAGHFLTHSPRKKAPASVGLSVPFRPLSVGVPGPALYFTGQRCSTQVGRNLQLGIEVTNDGNRAMMFGQIGTKFPMGGLRLISAGIGACGELPAIVPYPPSLDAGSTEWIVATVGVQASSCPGPLPVWFTVQYSMAGKTTSQVIAAFPDLGPVPYRGCPTNVEPNTSSPTVSIVDPASGRSYGG